MKLIVLDFETSEVYVYTYDSETTDAEDVVGEDGVPAINDNCQWMTTELLKINIE